MFDFKNCIDHVRSFIENLGKQIITKIQQNVSNQFTGDIIKGIVKGLEQADTSSIINKVSEQYQKCISLTYKLINELIIALNMYLTAASPRVTA